MDSLNKIQTGLASFQKALTMAEEDNSNNKLTVAKASEIFNLVLPQLKELGNMVSILSKAVLEIKNTACKETEDVVRHYKEVY